MATWRPKLTLYPLRDETEPDRRLDELLVYFRAQPDGAQLADWFIENISGAFKLPVITGHRDPAQHLEKLGKAFIEAMHVESLRP